MNLVDAMQIFVRVAELASFTRAAETMSLPKASISTAVRQLETSLGTRLLHRTTRRVELTLDGRAFYDRSRDLLADIDEAQAMFHGGGQALRGRLRVDMPERLAHNYIMPLLPGWLDEHPELEIEVSSTDRRVDPVSEGFDCVLRVGTLADSSLVARLLGNLQIGNYVSPGYIARHGMPETVADLPAHRMVHYVSTLGTRPDGFEYFDGTAYQMVPMRGAVTVNNTNAYEAACIAGLGLVQTPTLVVQPLIDAGKLVEVMRDFRAAPMPVSFVYPHRRNLPHRVQSFMDLVAGALSAHLS
ncbi:DNA-binding transcriptional LysR family regulator [Luteibacter sp. Sphag1AF]|uniref:LysR family transcriptional regulator n=1 Tax=Luteibacter sp. Sphag1AF TaxID=2587031 RepID=UPI00161BD3BA|nr:LysR family transcriptional regulator [Luteibacter sp. Sphag1AF]MBB3228278.1 DNA-binding transcriptional LysR family regulator [Luteibacter sp. Sphag1AF]